MRHPLVAPTLGVIVNPHALGVRRRRGLAGRLARIAPLALAVEETRDAGALDAVAQRFCAAGVDLVALAGGDGTNLYTLSALARAYGPKPLPRIALLRGGTVNTVASNLGVRGDPERLLGALVDAAQRGSVHTRPQTLLGVAFPAQTTTPLYGFLFAAAMGARFLEAYYAHPDPGPRSAALLALRTAASSLVAGPFAARLFAPLPLSLRLDGEPPTSHAARLLVAATIPDVGLGMRVAWRAQERADRFHLVASALSTPSMALQLPRVLAGRALHGAPHLDRLAARADLEFAAPEVFTLDGELFRAAQVALRLGPRVDIVRV